MYHQTTVELYCNISAHPVPTVQWYKDNDSIESKVVVLRRWLSCDRALLRGFYRVRGDVGRLIICKPLHADHTGFYTCSAANRKGKSNATAFLDVLGKKVVFYQHRFLPLQSIGRSVGRSVGWPVVRSIGQTVSHSVS